MLKDANIGVEGSPTLVQQERPECGETDCMDLKSGDWPQGLFQMAQGQAGVKKLVLELFGVS